MKAQDRAELKLDVDAGATVGTILEFSLVLSTEDPVQGFVAAFEWDDAVGVGDGLVPGAALADADTVVTRVESDYMVLGVVMDSDGLDDEIIPPGDEIVLASVRIRCVAEGSSQIVFADGKYAAVEGGPLLDNLVAVDGQSVDASNGLSLTAGSFHGLAAQYALTIKAREPWTEAGAAADILLENQEPVEGFVVAVCHETEGLEVTDMVAGPATAGADFVDVDIASGGGVLAVVMDLNEPHPPVPPVIPPGKGNHVATFFYDCANVSADPEEALPLHFCDGLLGDPPKENTIVVEGRSIGQAEGLLLQDGAIVCKQQPCVEESPAAGNCSDGIDNDCDGSTDAQDPGCRVSTGTLFSCGSREVDPASGLPGDVESSIGEETDLCFFLSNQDGHVQGFSMALSYCCDIEVIHERLDVAGTILEAIGAEYIEAQADNDPDDGDGCELVIGVLVDALPPFDGATIPPMDQPMRMGCVTFRVKDDTALCGSSCSIEFTDGVNGTGKVPARNLIAVDNESHVVAMTGCGIAIVARERFYRGDCNFSGGSSSLVSWPVDISDAAAIVSFLFYPDLYRFDPPCLDACDCNDDGRIDLADSVCVLKYLFQGGRFPPAPGPGLRETGLPGPAGVEPAPPGVDPTEDLLDCAAGSGCG